MELELKNVLDLGGTILNISKGKTKYSAVNKRLKLLDPSLTDGLDKVCVLLYPNCSKIHALFRIENNDKLVALYLKENE